MRKIGEVWTRVAFMENTWNSFCDDSGVESAHHARSDGKND